MKAVAGQTGLESPGTKELSVAEAVGDLSVHISEVTVGPPW